MIKEKMTVHKALSELKTLENRINAVLQNACFVMANKHGNGKINGKPIADFNASAVDDYKSATALINRRNAIKRAVIQSNATTKVVIDGKEYSVAEAIDMKTAGIKSTRALINVFGSQLEMASRTINRENGEKLDTRADQYVKTMFEGADVKNLSEEARKLREDFIATQSYELVDPLNAEGKLKALNKEVDAFMTEVDSALSVSNALTTIDIEYEA